MKAADTMATRDQTTCSDSRVQTRPMLNHACPIDQLTAISTAVSDSSTSVAAPLTKEGAVYGWLVGVNKRRPETVDTAPDNSLGRCSNR